MEPIAERLDLPDAYGTTKVTLAWDAVRDRLEQAPRYWLVTNRPDGRAHVVPVDGLWLDDTWYYGGSPETLHHRNLERDPRAVVHLEDTVAAVIIEGSMQRLTPTLELGRRLAAASKAKYGYAPTPEMYAGGFWGLRPDRARAWKGFPTDATRFRFA